MPADEFKAPFAMHTLLLKLRHPPGCSTIYIYTLNVDSKLKDNTTICKSMRLRSVLVPRFIILASVWSSNFKFAANML
jgi:hypothetical protein